MVREAECPDLTVARCRLRPPTEQLFVSRLQATMAGVSIPSGERIFVLDASQPPQVLYDSAGQLGPDATLPPPVGVTEVSGTTVNEGQVRLGSVVYVLAAAKVEGPYARWMVVGQPQAAVSRRTEQRLLPLLLAGSVAALFFAVVVAVLLAHPLVRPLRELREAAEGIAGGDYERRVSETGAGEVGVVARAFNRMAEAVERSRVQQRAFLADVSHELKTPLTSLIGFSQAMVDGSLRTDEERQRAAEVVNEEAHRLLRMSGELLDLARVDADQVTYERGPVDVCEQLRQEVEMVQTRARSRTLHLGWSVPANLAPALGDPERVHQVLSNLFDNAVKYAPEGSVIEVGAWESGERIAVEVGNRVAANPPDPDRMFDRFYRADPSRADSGGVGLGLAISRDMIRAQGGDLGARLEGDRLRVTLTMPRAS
ncbi:MAG TPA: HAMP domain-containing sensor histidine kinase [Candidatus Dormibacteraeota bacterium]|nr:HAMP domain-containing sensor histidine kinase [Candidatus Dormibacteraeota bacterium]